MNCGNCGIILPSDAVHCPNCGSATSNYYSFYATTPNDPTVVTPPYGAESQIPPTLASSPYSPGPQLSPTRYGDSQPYQATPPPPTPYNPPTPYPYTPYPAPPPAPVPTPPQRRSNRIGIIIGVAALVLLLIGGSAFALLRLGSRNSPAIATPTVNATATAHANATATAAVEDPYTHSGTLFFTDSLSDNSKGHGWDENSNCAFNNGTYHAIAPNVNFSDYCLAQNTNLGNFVFEVQMKILKGDAGGVVFRAESVNPSNQLYAFSIGQDGSYYLHLQNASGYPILTKGNNPAINQGLNATNLIAVVAQGSTITLYVNHQPIDKVTDSTYNHGWIGTFVVPYTQQTEVAFSNARVWVL